MTTRRTWRLGAATVAAWMLAQAVAEAGDAFGLWLHPETGSQIETYPCDGDLCARIKKTTDGQAIDDKNPDPEKRTAPIIGLVFISHAVPTGAGTWSGNIYNRIDGRTYEGSVTLKGRNRLELTACTAVVVCRSVIWSRAP